MISADSAAVRVPCRRVLFFYSFSKRFSVEPSGRRQRLQALNVNGDQHDTETSRTDPRRFRSKTSLKPLSPLQALNALLQIQQGMEQLRTAAPSLVSNLGLGVGAAAAAPPPPPAPGAPAPNRQQQNTELFTQV